MSRILNAAGVTAVGMTVATMLIAAEPGFALDFDASSIVPPVVLVDDAAKVATESDATTAITAPQAQPADLPKPLPPVEQTAPKADLVVAAPTKAASLAALVAATPRPSKLDEELRCLAGAVYFESRGESLSGQLAVAHVVINRAESGRFPTSLCGVVHQRSQFSFVRGGKMPAIREGVMWSNAIAIAQIAMNDGWKSHAPGALYFHARHVSPGWRKTRIAQIDNHIFYR